MPGWLHWLLDAGQFALGAVLLAAAWGLREAWRQRRSHEIRRWSSARWWTHSGLELAMVHPPSVVWWVLGRLSRRHATSGPLVSTGIAGHGRPRRTLAPDRCLEPGTDYVFWFATGARPRRGAIDTSFRALVPPPDAGPGTELHVAVFAYPDELVLDPAADVGVLSVHPGGIRIAEQPAARYTGSDRLCFPFRTPAREGRFRLRCNVYCRRTLLQSRVVEVTVRAGGTAPEALRTVVDYVAGGALDHDTLTDVEPLRLSVLVNDNGDGTSAFRFFGEQRLKADVVLDRGELQDEIDRARRTLSHVAWGDAGGWTEGARYRYGRLPGSTFHDDLITMALSGYRFWAHTAGRFAERVEPPLPREVDPPISGLQSLMRRPGVVEVAGKSGLTFTVPVALFYDYPLDTVRERLRVCPDALAAIGAAGSGAGLAATACFRGECPAYRDPNIVCPGGFWGFRHAVALPQSLTYAVAGDAVPDDGPDGRYLDVTDRPNVIVGVADEFAGAHEQWVASLGATHRRYDDRDALLAGLRDRAFGPHLVYLYCHGSDRAGLPAVVVGQSGSPGIGYELIADGGVYWPRTHPLVFLNGCRTATVEPRVAMNFVDAFVRVARASGLIGTEITTDERLGARFGRAFLECFVERRDPLAAALLDARLTLLAEGDPLGMAFVGYAAPQLRIRVRPPVAVPA
ncbi:hypothetical protein [Dactylosporangium sp. NPDC049140]|uniref:hypothetical protein n=1 Tax=Dactylosporangium sp. NPDC049140 TaxID=3155647 RepID=UPI0033D05814